MNSRASTFFFSVLVILFGIFTGVTGYYLGYNRLVPQISFVRQIITPTPGVRVGGVQATPTSTGTDTPTPTPIPTPSVSPKTVVDTFMKDFIASAPPKSNASAQTDAKNLLSTDAQKALASQNASSIVGGLAKMIGVASVPTGYTIGNPTLQTDTAIVPTTWDYLTGSVSKVFYLVDQNNQWKIDTIRDK